MLIAVIDFETTGFDDDARVVELGVVKFNTEDALYHRENWQGRFNPGIPIPPEASAIHHLTDADVADRPYFDSIGWMDATIEADTLAAHNADYDRRFVPFDDDRVWIDTWRCALRVWPDAPGFGNQVLRYWLKLELDLPSDLHPHCALYDAITTAGILQQLMGRRSVADLIKISAEPALLPRIDFGKHRGLRFSEVPKDYLSWVLKQDFNEHVKHTARYWLERP